MNKLPMRLKELRQSKNISQRQIAKELNISQVSYCHWETGQNQPSIETLILLCQYFDVSADYLIGLTDY